MPNGPQATIRYKSKTQLERFKRAARLNHWSLNVFTLVACEQYADECHEYASPKDLESDAQQQQAAGAE